MPRILVVDDEIRYCQILEMMLRHENHEVVTASEGQQAARLLDQEEFDLVISDLRMEPYSGIDLLRHRNVVAPDVPFIVLTAFGSIPSAVEMVREGALDYLTKPFQEEAILATVRNALKVRALAEENRNLRQLLKESLGETVFLGDSPSVKAILERVKKVSPTDLTVLLLGETGTGKDLLARMIHNLSGRKEGPFVKVNCAAIPASLLESELFGYERGAFSGATSRHKGKFQISQGGTLFLDEIGDLENGLQAKILQAIEEKRFFPLGGPREVEVNCRILAASNRPLEEMVKDGRFRQDLYHRLMAFPIQVSPLRERREDIRILAGYYFHAFAQEMGNCPLEIAPRVWELLTAYSWPGNVRELMNVLRSAVLMCRGRSLDLGAFSSYPVLWEDGDLEEQHPAANVIPINPFPTLAQAEKELIQRALQSCNGNQAPGHHLLGISRSLLRYRLMLHNL